MVRMKLFGIYFLFILIFGYVELRMIRGEFKFVFVTEIYLNV